MIQKSPHKKAILDSKQCNNITDQYHFIEKLGEGFLNIISCLSSFGLIWKVQDIKSKQILACKLIQSDLKKKKCLLMREMKILSIMKGFQGKPNMNQQGFSQIRAYGQDSLYTFFLMDCLGLNLEMIRLKTSGVLSQSIVMDFAVQMIDRLQVLHQQGIIHRDIKPENFVVDKYDDKQLFLIDFGLSKLYIRKGEHIPEKEKHGMIGTARYASINALKGNEQSRRDDIESVGYLIIFLTQGHLPWMNIEEEDRKTKYNKILRMKETIKPEMLAFNLPKVKTYQKKGVIEFLKYSRNLSFLETPDYQLLKAWLRSPHQSHQEQSPSTPQFTIDQGAQTLRCNSTKQRRHEGYYTDRQQIQEVNYATSRQPLGSLISSTSMDFDQTTEKVSIDAEAIKKMIIFKKPNSFSPKSENLVEIEEQFTCFKQYSLDSNTYQLK